MKRIKAHIVKCPCKSPLTCPATGKNGYTCTWGCLAYIEYRLKVEAARRANIKYEQKKDKTNYQFSTPNGVTFQISMDKDGNFLW